MLWERVFPSRLCAETFPCAPWAESGPEQCLSVHLGSIQSHFPQFTLFAVTGLLPVLGEILKRAVDSS